MKATILLVEDNPTTRKLVRFALGQRGYEVIEASTGKLAIEAIARRAPDLVLQDLILPDVNGFELVADLRARLKAPRVPILAFTGFLSMLDESRISAAGFDDIIVKPIEPSRLVQVIQTYLPADPAPAVDRFGSGRRLVVADDDPMQRKLAAFRLERLGFEVVTVADGVAALESARAAQPAAIVADIMMPKLDGFRLCAEAKRDRRLRELPVILMTSSYVEEADRKLAHATGAVACVLRTPDFREVVSALRSALENPAPPSLSVSVGEAEVEQEHGRRVIQQLERQVAMNSGIAQRCALLTTELSILSGISSTLSRGGDIDASLDEVLAAFFDAAGVSTGALVLFNVGAAHVRRFGLATRCSVDEVGSFFGDMEELRALLRERQPLSLPLEDGRLERSRQAMARAGIRRALVVPISVADDLLGLLVLSSNGTPIATDERVAFAVGVAGQIAQAVALTRAFAARRDAEREACEKAAMLEAIMQSIPDGVAVADEAGRFLLWNSGADAIIRLGSSNMDPTAWSAHYGLYLPDRTTPYPPADLPLVRAMRGETVERVEVFVRHSKAPDGVWLSVNARPLVQDGSPRGGVALFRDVTAEKAAHEQLMVSDRMASVGTLAAGVAHEINNPLAVVLANLEFAVKDARELEAQAGASPRLTDIRECLAEAREAADRVRQIVKDLKIFSRAEEDRRGAVDTRRVLESALRMAWNEIRHRARLVKEYDEVPLVLANESRLGQVFLNLVVNAAQALPEGAANTNEIRVRTSTDAAGRVVVEIRDSGSGMPPETLKRLFTPFFTTKQVGVGTGLGLAICHRIVTGLGGEIAVESQVGVGTTFKVFLPAAQAEGVEPEVARVASAATRRGRVLVIDDDPMITSVVRRVLSAEHDVLLLTGAEEALSCISAGQRFDVILCNVMMPVVTGMDFYERLAEQLPDQSARIVFLTGGAFTLRAREFLDKVPNARLEKPFDTQNLRSVVNDRIR